MNQVPQEPIDVVRAFVAAVEVNDFDAALKYVSDDCDYENIPIGPVRGPAAMRELLEPVFASVLENDFVIKNVATEGPVVFIERLDRHRLPSGWVEIPIAGVWEVHDGQITAWREYFDLPTLEKAFAQG